MYRISHDIGNNNRTRVRNAIASRLVNFYYSQKKLRSLI